MRIELLYFDGCPNFLPTRDLVRAILRDEGLAADIFETEVEDVQAAERLQFIGSPTIRINGLDIEAGARNHAGVGLTCRRYANGLLPETAIRAALKEARGK